jgi:hypothetical protein
MAEAKVITMIANRNEHVSEIVDDQVKQHPVKARCMCFDIVFPCQRTVDAIDRKGHNQPQEHDGPFFLSRCQQGQHGKNGSGRGQEVDAQRAGLITHSEVLAELLKRCNWSRVFFPRL